MNKQDNEAPQFNIYVISDGTGQTAMDLVHAAIVQYEGYEKNLIRIKNIKSELELQRVLDEAHGVKSLIAHTIVSQRLREYLSVGALSLGLPCVDLIGPMFQSLDEFFETSNSHSMKAGLLRVVDENYFKKIEAIEFSVRHDDGKTPHELDLADIVLVGMSRTSKTPLSIYLSHKALKVANIPLVLDQPLPKELFEIDQRKIVVLNIDEQKLSLIRRKRLEKFGQDPSSEYADMKHILKEMEYAQDIYKKNRRWPIVNVTDRSIEETASEVIRIVSARLGKKLIDLF